MVELRDKYGHALETGFYEDADKNLIYIRKEGEKYYVSSLNNRKGREIRETEIPRDNPNCNICRTDPWDHMDERTIKTSQLIDFIKSVSGGTS